MSNCSSCCPHLLVPSKIVKRGPKYLMRLYLEKGIFVHHDKVVYSVGSAYVSVLDGFWTRKDWQYTRIYKVLIVTLKSCIKLVICVCTVLWGWGGRESRGVSLS
jgi:hypothetical protein